MCRKAKIAVFSGRFDPFHIGHLLTIKRLSMEYMAVIVVMLEYEGREFCTNEKMLSVIKTVLSSCDSQANIFVTSNKTHFAKITKSEYYDISKKALGVVHRDGDEYEYISGNNEVIHHMDEIGITFRYYPRSFDGIYTGTMVRATEDKEKYFG